MNLLKRFKKVISLAVVGLTVFGVSTNGAGALAANPDFNKLEGDREFTVGRTQNQPEYSDPVSATTSDRVTVAVYYHNNITGTTATNVTIKSILPTNIAKTHVVTTSLSADNASTIYDTVVNGQIVGSPNLTINLDQAAKLSYVPGSTKWFPNLQQNPNQPGIQMPDGIVGAGLNIGGIEGCWSFAGYVLYDLAFSSQPLLETEKWVAKYGGDNQWVKTNTANAGDELRYQILFGNTGNGTAKNVRIQDRLPEHVTYVPNTAVKRVLDSNGNDQDIVIPDSQITFTGSTMTIPVGDVLPGQNNSGYVYIRVKIDPNLIVGFYTLTNIEDLLADNAITVNASAVTTVTVTPTPVSDVKLLKEVANISQGSARWVKSNTAKPGDSMQYRLTVYNQGTKESGEVTLKDVLPQYISYVPGSTKIYTSNPLDNGSSLPDGITIAGVSIGKVMNGVPNGNRFIVFDVKVSNVIPSGNQDLTNSADVFEAGVKKDTSTALTTVTSETGLILTKEVWNASNATWVTSMSAKPGDVVTYRLMVRNTGNTTITGIVLKDTLPQYVTYVLGSSREDGVSISDAWITTGAGQLLPNLTAGNFKIITFQAKIGACPPGGTYTLTNKVDSTATGLPNKSATADVIVTASAPNVPR